MEGSKPFLEDDSGFEAISNLASVKDSAINLSPVSDSTILPQSSSEAIQYDETSKYLPLKLGETISKELSTSMRYFKVGTPRLHLTLSYDQATRAIEQLRYSPSMHTSDDANHRNNATFPLNVKYRVDVKWLHSDEQLKARSDVSIVDLKDFPHGSQKTVDLQDRGQLKDLWLSKENDLLVVTYRSV